MEYVFIPTPTFEKSYKRLKKKYHSLKTDLEAFKKEYNENPALGENLGGGFRKIRIAVKSKNRGKRGGARIITYDMCIKTEDKVVILVEIYDKSEISTLSEMEYEMVLSDFLEKKSTTDR
jgi:mRNA-degrading endonuclease RelE of RelBE toxin-antitoxin system